ncbi:unnamed protein product [Agarophyton chilense]
MQQHQTVTFPAAAEAAFLPLTSPCLCTSRSPLLLQTPSPLRHLASRAARHTVARRQRARFLAEQPQSPPESSSDETNEETTSDHPEQTQPLEEVDLPVPNAFEVSGEPGCIQCSGKGEIDCPVCDAKGFYSINLMDTVSSSSCRLCMGRRTIPCPSCRQIVYKSVLWWDQIPSAEEDPEQKWTDGPDGPRFGWGENPSAS